MKESALELLTKKPKKEKCITCNKNDAQDEHTCPYQSEINENCEFECNCCDDCIDECRGAI